MTEIVGRVTIRFRRHGENVPLFGMGTLIHEVDTDDDLIGAIMMAVVPSDVVIAFITECVNEDGEPIRKRTVNHRMIHDPETGHVKTVTNAFAVMGIEYE